MPFTPRPERELFNTANASDARFVGLDGPVEHYETDGLRLTFRVSAKLGPVFTLNGPDGEIELDRHTAKVISEMMAEQVRYAEQDALVARQAA